MNPKVTVLMAVHNAEKYVYDAVRSVLLQTEHNFEAIILNDGSTDRSIEQIGSAVGDDARVRIISRENRGLTASLNEGLALAKAPLIARMDADDICLPERLERQLSYMQEHAECVAVGSQVFEIDDDGRPIGEWRRPLHHEEIDRLNLHECAGIVHPTVMFRRDAIKSIGGYNERLRSAQDLDLFLRLAEIGKLANLDQVLLKYRRHSQSVTFTRIEEQTLTAQAVKRECYLRRGMQTAPHSENRIPTVEEVMRSSLHKAYRNAYFGTVAAYAAKLLMKHPGSIDLWKLFLRCVVLHAFGRSAKYPAADSPL